MLPIFGNKTGVVTPPLQVKIMTCASVKVSFVLLLLFYIYRNYEVLFSLKCAAVWAAY